MRRPPPPLAPCPGHGGVVGPAGGGGPALFPPELDHGLRFFTEPWRDEEEENIRMQLIEERKQNDRQKKIDDQKVEFFLSTLFLCVKKRNNKLRNGESSVK